MSFEARLALATPLPPCTSSTRRADIGGLPPRVGIPIAPDKPAAGWQLRDAAEAAVRGAVAPDEVARRRKIDRIRRALASGAALGPVLASDETALRRQADAMDASDPRLDWLLAQAPRWRHAGEKTLVFVAHRETLEMLRTALSHRAQLASGMFHEELSPARRDTEVARFREAGGPSLLVSTECGGEGRNFEFCRRLVLFDLPWKPTIVEQRIGRLDRIGRRIPVDVVYFRPPERDRRGRRAALRGARSLPRAAGRPGAATGPRRGRSRGSRARSSRRRSPANASRPWSARPTRRAHASAKRPISSSIATRTDRRWPQASSRACPGNSTR